MEGDKSDDFASASGTVRGADPCSICDEIIIGDLLGSDFVMCLSCCAEMHLHCRGLAKKGKPVTKAVIDILAAPWFAGVYCNSCRPGTDPASARPAQLAQLKKDVAEIKEGQEALLAVLTKPASGSLRPGLSFAGAAAPRPGQASASPLLGSGLVTAVAQAVRQSGEDELRARSLVIDGLPEVDGESDAEKVAALISFAGISATVRVESLFRMGPQSVSGSRPRKLKVVLHSPGMQRLLLEKRVRELLRSPACPDSLGNNVFISPSRTWEQRRLLLKLRRRRDHLNSGIDDAGERWFLDHGRYTLVKRFDGQPDWKGQGDIGFDEWALDFDRRLPPRQPLRRPAPASAPSQSQAKPRPPLVARQGNS